MTRWSRVAPANPLTTYRARPARVAIRLGDVHRSCRIGNAGMRPILGAKILARRRPGHLSRKARFCGPHSLQQSAGWNRHNRRSRLGWQLCNRFVSRCGLARGNLSSGRHAADRECSGRRHEAAPGAQSPQHPREVSPSIDQWVDRSREARDGRIQRGHATGPLNTLVEWIILLLLSHSA